MSLRPSKCFGIDGHKAKARRHHQAFLRTAQAHIGTQCIHIKGCCAQGSHHIDHIQCWVAAAVNGCANGLQIAGDAAGGVGATSIC
ncbi:MAG: hypothetical protein RL770_1243 [Pseudomonadota bacterium]